MRGAAAVAGPGTEGSVVVGAVSNAAGCSTWGPAGTAAGGKVAASMARNTGAGSGGLGAGMACGAAISGSGLAAGSSMGLANAAACSPAGVRAAGAGRSARKGAS
jgi:hypothetical protein